MQYNVKAECIEIVQADSAAVIVAEGLRNWQSSGGEVWISRGPRLWAESETLGRLRVVPDRLGMLDGAAETHAVVLARKCPGEEMEITQRWQGDEEGLFLDLSFIVPPAWDGMTSLGVELELPPGERHFKIRSGKGISAPEELEDSGVSLLRIRFDAEKISAGIHRMQLGFHQFSQSSSK